MAFFYIKNTGTATGDAGRSATPRTGTWNASAGDSYATPLDALAATTPPTNGDVMCVSNASLEVVSTNTDVRVPPGVIIMSVDDAAQDQYAPAVTAQFSANAGNNYEFRQDPNATNISTLLGINTLSQSTTYLNERGAKLKYTDVTYSFRSNDIIFINREWGTYYCVNTKFINPNYLNMRSCKYTFFGGEIQAQTGLWISGYNTDIVADGVNFSNGTANLFRGAGTTSTVGDVTVRNGPLPVAWTTSNILGTPGSTLRVVCCDAFYQYFVEDYAGEIDFVIDRYYTAHETLSDGSTQGSLEFVTNGNASITDALRYSTTYQAPEYLSADNSEAATKTKVRLRFATASGNTLNAEDVSFIVGYADSAVPYHSQWREILVSPTQSGIALSTETGAWTGSGLGTQYYIDLQMDNPGNGEVRVIPCINKPNVTVYFSWQLEFVA